MKLGNQERAKEIDIAYLHFVSQILGFIALLMSLDMYRQYANVSFFSHFLSVFYDLETKLKVYPTEGRRSSKSGQKGQPFFRYYPGEESPLKGVEGSFSYTIELITFIKAFETIKQFQIESQGKSSLIIPREMMKLKRIDFEDDYCILKFYVDIEDTKPYSAYYYLNGRLGIEFFVTSHPSRLKRKELADLGIPLYEVKANFPKWIQEKFPKEYEDKNLLEKIANEVRRTYQETNYRLLGKFKHQHKFLEDNERKYKILKSFEEKCDELESKIEERKKEKEELEKAYQNLLMKYQRLEENVKKIQFKQENQQRLEKENEALLKENRKLNKVIEEKDNQVLTSQKQLEQLSEKCKTLEDRGLIARIVNKKI